MWSTLVCYKEFIAHGYKLIKIGKKLERKILISYLLERTPFLINAARVLQMSHCSLNSGNQSNVLYISVLACFCKRAYLVKRNCLR